ncbi:cilia- and flagella-associated protein 251-like isoform X2 [Columba livia]|uniref:cilia- and flagella-associated protein 251-like isoform X2 n=1 Tax=Columba livia TaxID=8932 RepID=UPI0031BBB17B
MGVSRAKNSSRKQKSELKKGKEAPKASRRKTVKKEPEEIRHVVQPPVVKGEKKRSPKAKEKPLQENVISSSLKQEAAEGKGVILSPRDGIQAEEEAASGLETESTHNQGPSVGLGDSSRSQHKLRRPELGAGWQLSATKVPKPSDGVAGGAASLSGEPGALKMDAGVTTMRKGEEKELDPPVPQQQGSKRKREKKQEQRKQQEKKLVGKGGRKKAELEENPVDVMEGVEEEEGVDGGRNQAGGWSRTKRGSSSTQGWGDGRKKQEKGKAEKHKKAKRDEVEKMRKKKRRENTLEEEQVLEKTDEEGEKEEGEGLKERDGRKESEGGKVMKEEEEEVDAKGDEGWGETWSAEVGQEMEEDEVGEGNVSGKQKKRKIKEKKPKEEMEEKEKKSKEKSEEEEVPKKTQKRKSKEEGEEKNNKKAKKEEKEEEKKESENKWKW